MTGMRPETTLADHLGLLRRRRVLIVLVAVICGAAAFAFSAAQKKSYDATASLAVNDPNQDLSLLGTALVTNETPLQLASIHAPLVTRPEVLTRVKATLHSPLSLTALRQAVTVGIDPNSFLVTIDAQSPHPATAAAVANAFAQADVALTTAATRRGYSVAAANLAGKLRHLPAATAPSTKAIYTEKLSELQSLSSIATPVAVSATATAPTSPTSPKTARNTIAALIFGLLLGIALAYGREALDRRLRGSAEVEEQLQYPVIGRVRGDALGNPTAAFVGGANGSGPSSDIDAESFRVLRHNVRYLAAGEGLRTLLVTSAMAQEGKSTVAAGLAVASAQAGKRTLLIECDLRRPVLASRFGIAPAPGLTEYLTGQAAPREILRVLAPVSAPRNGHAPDPAIGQQMPLVCITAGTPPPRPADLLASERFQALLSELGDAYEVVVVDSPPLLSAADTLEIVPCVSGVLLCVRLGHTTREQARAGQAALDRLPPRPTGLVLTDVKEAEDAYFGYYRDNAKEAGRERGRGRRVRA